MRKLSILISALLVVSMVGGIASAQGPPEDAGPPHNIQKFTDTKTIESVQNDTNGTIEGAIRVDEEYHENTTITLNESNGTVLSMSIEIPSELNATNVTFFLQQSAVENQTGANISNVSMFLDSGNHDWFVDESAGPGNSPWVLFEVPEFSERNVTFEATDSESGPTGSFTNTGIPDGATPFTNTTGIPSGNLSDQLSGQVFVDPIQAENLSVAVDSDENNRTTMTLESNESSSTTIYIGLDGLNSIDSDPDVEVDGELVDSNVTEQGGNEYLVFQTGHFSTKDVEITDSDFGPVSDGALDIITISFVVVVIGLLGAAYYLASTREIEFV